MSIYPVISNSTFVYRSIQQQHNNMKIYSENEIETNSNAATTSTYMHTLCLLQSEKKKSIAESYRSIGRNQIHIQAIE